MSAVTAADREAAADFATKYLYPNSSGVRSVLADYFAAHRIAAEQAARLAALEAAMEAVRAFIHGREIGRQSAFDDHAREILAAIEALKGAQG